jgi:hypothetical protein
MHAGVHAILGHRGSGKSRLARAIVAPSTKLIIVDSLAEHYDLAQTVTVDELATLLERNPDAYRYAVMADDYSYVDWLERVACKRPGCCLFIDEIDMWYTDARVPVGEGLSALVRYGRHYEQSVVAIARRPAAMSRSITSQATMWCFPMREPRDRKYVQDFSEFDPGTLEVLQFDSEGRILVTQVARIGVRGTEVGEFSLVTGQYTFQDGSSFSQEFA